MPEHSAPAGHVEPLPDPTAARLAAIVESSQDAIIAWSLDGQVTSWNGGAERLLGYRCEQAIGLDIRATWGPAERARFSAITARLAAGEAIPRFEGTCVRADTSIVEVSIALSPVKDATGVVVAASSIVRDVTELNRAHAREVEEQSRWAGAFHGALIGMALVGLDGSWLAVNPALCRLLGRDQADLLATDFQSLTHPDDPGSDLAQLRRMLAGEIEAFEIEKRYLRPGGGVVWAQLSVALVVRDGEPLYFVSQLQDITTRKRSEAELARYSEKLAQMARTDPLTGLRNHRDFQELIDAELGRSRRHGQPWSLVLLDIDGFGEITRRDRTDGDEVLYQVGTAIAASCRTSDVAARIGPDEFALILPGTSQADAVVAARRIASEVSQKGAAALSFGAVTWPHDGDTKELLLLRADMQLAAAKPPIRGSAHLSTEDGIPHAVGPVCEILSIARRHLAMDVAYVATIDEAGQTFTAISGDASSFGVAEGDALALVDTLCHRMLTGEIANIVPEVGDEAELAAVPIVQQAGIGSYLGVPITFANGHVYGTLCGISHGARPDLGDDHLQVMSSLARLLASQIETDGDDAGDRRAQAERTGIHALLAALMARDHYTGEHSQLVVRLATQVARALGLDEDAVGDVEQVALLHDIGKVGIPDSVLQKHAGLTEQEWGLMRQHPVIGARILAGTRSLAHLAQAVGAEHERFDGQGYPDGLHGDAIPLASRITFACDAYHAMTSDRPYRRALGAHAARIELKAGAGSQFDPRVVDALLHVLDHGDSPRAIPSADRRPFDHDVLTARTPRQTPSWTASGSAGSPAAVGEARAVCRRCGVHVNAVITRAALGGSCHNCGSYELEIADLTPRD